MPEVDQHTPPAVAAVTADDGVVLHAERDPGPVHDQRPTVLFTHGFTGATSTWDHQRAALRGRVPVVRWDQRGHGRSQGGRPDHATIDQTGRDLGVVVDAVAPAGPLVLVGHSMGGLSILALGGQRPELFASRVVGILLVATPAADLRRDDGPGAVLALSRRWHLLPLLVTAVQMAAPLLDAVPWRRGRVGHWVSRHVFGAGTDGDTVDVVHQQLEALRMDVAAAFWGALLADEEFVAWDSLRGIPVTVVGGHEDRLAPITHGRRIQEVLDGAPELVDVAGAGHDVIHTHHGDVDEALVSLLRRRRRLGG